MAAPRLTVAVLRGLAAALDNATAEDPDYWRDCGALDDLGRADDWLTAMMRHRIAQHGPSYRRRLVR